MKKVKVGLLRVKAYRLWVHQIHRFNRSALGKNIQKHRWITTVVVCLFCIILFLVLKSEISKRKELARLPGPVQDNSAKRVATFIDTCFTEINGNYRLGNNSALKGMQETKTWTNEFNDITNVQLSVHLFIAKENFERMLNDVKTIETFNDKTSQVKDLLLKAATMRMESIDLISKGFLLKERIGKTMVSNVLANKKENEDARVLPIPEYNGEIETGLGKIPVANSYIVEALKRLKMLADEIGFTEFYDVKIANTVGYYADALEGDLNSYMKEGLFYLSHKDYFNAVIALNRALKINPSDRDVLLKLIEAYLGLDGIPEAKTFLEAALKSYPDDEDFLALEKKLNLTQTTEEQKTDVLVPEAMIESTQAVEVILNKVVSDK